MKPLIIGLSYDMKTIFFSVLLPKASFFPFTFLRHIGIKMNKPWKSNKI